MALTGKSAVLILEKNPQFSSCQSLLPRNIQFTHKQLAQEGCITQANERHFAALDINHSQLLVRAFLETFISQSCSILVQLKIARKIIILHVIFMQSST